MKKNKTKKKFSQLRHEFLQVNEVTSSDTETPEKASSSSTSTSVKPTARKSISRELAALALDSPAADTVSRSRRPTGGGGRATTKPRRRGRSIEGLGNDDSDTENNGGSSDVNAMVPAAKLVEVEKKCEQLTNQLKVGLIVLYRAGEPANFLAAPAPDFFFKRLRLRLLIFSPSGSGSWYFFRAAPAPRGQKHPVPTGSGSLAKYSFLRKKI